MPCSVSIPTSPPDLKPTGSTSTGIDLSGENSKEKLRRIAAYYSRELSELESMAEQSPTVGVFLSRLLDDYARKQGKPRWAEKTPGNIIHAERLFDLWPNAKLIHIVRDPRDIFASRRQAKKWDDPDYFAELWCSFFGRGREGQASAAVG